MGISTIFFVALFVFLASLVAVGINFARIVKDVDGFAKRGAYAANHIIFGGLAYISGFVAGVAGVIWLWVTFAQ